MKYKTLFRLGLRLLGVYLCTNAFASVLELVSTWGILFPITKPDLRNLAVSAMPFVGETIGGLYLFFGGEWIVNLAIPSNRPYCPECAYDLRGNSAERCPECGTPIDMEKLRPPDSTA